MTVGIEAHYSEYWLRSTLQEYALQIVCSRRRGIADLPWADRVANHLERLRNSPKASDSELLKMLGDVLSFISDEERLVQFLEMLPGSSPLGAMSTIAGCLFHPSKEVRRLAGDVLHKVEASEAKELVSSNLSKFLLTGLARSSGQADGAVSLN